MNPQTGSGVEQTRKAEVEKTAAEVRNLVSGTFEGVGSFLDEGSGDGFLDEGPETGSSEKVQKRIPGVDSSAERRWKGIFETPRKEVRRILGRRVSEMSGKVAERPRGKNVQM